MKQIAAAIIWNHGRVLIGRRPTSSAQGGYWEFPGGKLMPGETPEECVVRECLEELSVKIQVNQLRMKTGYRYDEWFQFYFFDAQIISGEIRQNVHTALRWIAPDDFDQVAFCPANAEVLRKIKERCGEG